MDCPEYRKLISKRLDGELSPDEETALASHLSGCGQCVDFVEALSRITFFESQRIEEQPPGGISDRVFSTIGKRHMTGWQRFVVASAACLIMLLGAGTGYYLAARPVTAGRNEADDLRYLEAYPPDSVGEMLMVSAEGGRDV